MPRGRPKKRKHSPLAPPCLQSPKKRQLNWTNERMVKAMDAVKSGNVVAAENYNVPRVALLDQISGESSMEVSLAHYPIFTKKKKLELAQFVVKVSESGYGKTRKQIKGIVEKVTGEKGI